MFINVVFKLTADPNNEWAISNASKNKHKP